MKAYKVAATAFASVSLTYYLGCRNNYINTDFSVYQLFYNAVAQYDLGYAIKMTQILLKRNLLWKVKQQDTDQATQLGDHKINNVIGLAAGYDINGHLFEGLQNLGFGFLEIGSVQSFPSSKTAVDQNDYNKLSYVSEIPNQGILLTKSFLVSLRKNGKTNVPFAVNIVPNEDTIIYTPYLLEKDIENSFREIVTLADIAVLNLAGSETIGPIYRDYILKGENLNNLLQQLQKARYQEIALQQSIKYEEIMKKKDEKFKDYISSNYNSTPFFPNKKLSSDVYVKIKGNENKVIYEKICQFCKQSLINGLIIEKSKNQDVQDYLQNMRYIASQLNGQIPLVSVGDINNGQDVRERVENGAWACQIYSSFVRQGPTIPQKLQKEISEIVRSQNLQNLEQLRGIKIN